MPYRSETDPRLAFLKAMAVMFKTMDAYSSSTKTRVKGLTTDTSNALHVTLNGIVNIVPILLRKMSYVLTADFQSDRLEGEFGIFRQMSGGNFHISVTQVMNSLSLQRIKLYNELQIQNQEHLGNDCCSKNLAADEIDLFNDCFEHASKLSPNERSILYYIAGYVAHKEKSNMRSGDIPTNKDSEFTIMVSRGKLDHPNEQLFDLTLYLYAYYDLVSDKRCSTRLLVAFEHIYDYTNYQIKNHISVLRRLTNCFGKASAKQASEIRIKENKQRNIKRLRLSNSP